MKSADERRNTFSAAECAAVLGVSEATVRNRVRDGTVAGRKVGNAWRVPDAEVAEILRVGWARAMRARKLSTAR
jgi:excisionase family DNA binding protein